MATLVQMQMLSAVAKERSITAAAAALGVTAAAVSKQLTRLEEELQVLLLKRSTRKVELTPIGESYLKQCRGVLEAAREAQSVISGSLEEPEGELRVLSGRHFAFAYLLPHFKEFGELYPKVQISLELAERVPDFSAEPLDVFLGANISAKGNPVQKRIGCTQYLFCASPEYLKKWGIPTKKSALKNHRYLSHSMRLEEEVENPYLRLNDSEGLLRLAKGGVGIVKLHEYVVRSALSEGVLVELFPKEKKKELSLYASFVNQRFLPSKVRLFLDFVERKVSYPL